MSGHSVASLVDGGYFNLHAGDKILVYGDTTNILDVMVSCEEYFNPTHGT